MATPAPARPKETDWTKPAAMAIPKDGYFTLEKGRYGPIFPKTPACHGFSVVAKVIPGREQAIRDYGKKIMKEFESSGPGQSKGLVWAIGDTFTVAIVRSLLWPQSWLCLS